MSRKKQDKEALTVAEALDTLSSVADLHPDEVRKEGLKTFTWAGKTDALSSVKSSFSAIQTYLEELHSGGKATLKDPEKQKGIRAIMNVASKAAEKFDACSSLFSKAHAQVDRVSDSSEFKHLRAFYEEKILQQFEEVLESEEEWLRQWGEEKSVKDIEQVGLKDLETVKKDREYELFSLLDDEGRPFYNKNLLRHIKLVSDFDFVIHEGIQDDPLLKSKVFQDKDVFEASKEILHHVSHEVHAFYRDALKFKEHQIVCYLNMAVMALSLAANERHLMKNTRAKSCLSYFYDFQYYLREAFIATSYPSLMELQPAERDSLLNASIALLHALCFNVYTRKTLHSEVSALVQQLISADKKTDGEIVPFLNYALESHDAFDRLLKRYPNGPLFKTLDIFKEETRVFGFDPYLQENLPAFLYSFGSSVCGSKVIRMPCPTRQERIDSAFIIEEWRGFLRGLANLSEKKKVLLFNFQERTSAREYARCHALEELQADAEFAKHFFVVTLPKSSDFYMQTNEYAEESSAVNFFAEIRAQFEGGEACGFSFPKQVGKKELLEFVDTLLPIVHTHVFARAKKLSRVQRLDCIEVVYHFIMLKMVELLTPEYTAFISKDSIDIGACEAASFFLFMKLLSGEKILAEEEKDLIFSILFGPPLFVRERTLDRARITRFMSAVSTLTKFDATGIKGCEALFEKKCLTTLVTSLK